MAMTRFTGELFVRVWRSGDHYYGINKDGIHRLSGDTDNEESFPSLIRLANNNFGDDHLKRLTEIEVNKSGIMDAALIYDNVAVCNGVDTKENGLIKFSKGGGANAISILFHSTDENFSLRGIKLSPVVIGKGAL
jgi:hypothetical protein